MRFFQFQSAAAPVGREAVRRSLPRRFFWVFAVLLGLALPACQQVIGAVEVKVNLTGETRTHCVTVKLAGRPAVPVDRAPADGGREVDLLLIGVEASAVGGVPTSPITVQRYGTHDCSSQPIGAAMTKDGIFKTNTVSVLDFDFSESASDAGTDAGVDGGIDAGCDVAQCQAQAGLCQGTASCSTGVCTYSLRDAGSDCGDAGACDPTGVCKPYCQVLPSGHACDDGYSCTATSFCSANACVGQCALRECHRAVTPVSCATDSSCTYTTLDDTTPCDGGVCSSGGCVPGLAIAPSNLPDSINSFPYAYPTGGWTVAPGCTTVIDTALGVPVDGGGWCSTTPPSVKVGPMRNDAGQALILSMTQLSVGADASVSFVGSLPVILVVFGDAGVDGILSAASTGSTPGAGGNSSFCASTASNGFNATDKGGGGGGAWGANGGKGAGFGGADAGASPAAATLIEPLRGGCAGGNNAGAASGPGGAGGGAIQLSVGGTLLISSTGAVSASGGGGAAGSSGTGGAGAGSGGTVVLEATNLTFRGMVTTIGGGGGAGGTNALPGDNGAITVSAIANGGGGSPFTGGNGSNIGAGGDAPSSASNGGGGGGSFGVVFLRATALCDRSGIEAGNPIHLGTCN